MTSVHTDFEVGYTVADVIEELKFIASKRRTQASVLEFVGMGFKTFKRIMVADLGDGVSDRTAEAIITAAEKLGMNPSFTVSDDWVSEYARSPEGRKFIERCRQPMAAA